MSCNQCTCSSGLLATATWSISPHGGSWPMLAVPRRFCPPWWVVGTNLVNQSLRVHHIFSNPKRQFRQGLCLDISAPQILDRNRSRRGQIAIRWRSQISKLSVAINTLRVSLEFLCQRRPQIVAHCGHTSAKRRFLFFLSHRSFQRRVRLQDASV